MKLDLFEIAGNFPEPNITIFTGRSKQNVILLSGYG